MSVPPPSTATNIQGGLVWETTADRPFHVLLGVCGSVAAVKAPEIAVQLVEHITSQGRPCIVRILLTKGGSLFWQKAQVYNSIAWQSLQKDVERGFVEVLDADEEWHEWNKLGDLVLHIDLRNWADVFVIAPLSANTLAKLAHGLCDDTLSCVARAWEFGRLSVKAKPLVLAPAMNTAMWSHVLTEQQIATIRGFFNHDGGASDAFRIVEPQSKLLACGEYGDGALAEVSDIVAAVNSLATYCNTGSSWAMMHADDSLSKQITSLAQNARTAT